MGPALYKAKQIIGKNIILRDVTVDDAPFILSLRNNPKRNRFISSTSQHLEDQINWLRRYEKGNDQAYFIISDTRGESLGCVRMYDPEDYYYTWGSWLMVEGLAPHFSIESVLLVYYYGNSLGFKEAHLDVRKENATVWKFHENFCHAERIKETDVDYFYIMRESVIQKMLDKNARFIGHPSVVGY